MNLKFLEFYQALSREEQAGFFLWPSLNSTMLTDRERELLEQYKPSGIVLFKRNMESIEQTKALIGEIQQLTHRPWGPFSFPTVIAIDEEGGRVSRLPPPHVRGKPALAFADDANAEGLVELVKSQCDLARLLGINCLLAPVADILTQPLNPVMGDRCFGKDAQTVSFYAELVHNTIRQGHLLSCGKHFPGHGDTTTDSHKEFAFSHADLATLREREWVPFKTLIAADIPFIMAAHVVLPMLDKRFPATLSAQILKGHLRDELGFQGLILSDDLRMNAMADFYGVEKSQNVCLSGNAIFDHEDKAFYYLPQAGIDALNAGCDILLSCQSIEKEVMIAENIVTMFEQNEFFAKNMFLKAKHIVDILNKFQY